jgi:hypothetical protein
LGSCACADSASTERIDTSGNTIRERLDVFIFTLPPLVLPWSWKACRNGAILTGFVASPRDRAFAWTDRVGDIADGVGRFCLVTNL